MSAGKHLEGLCFNYLDILWYLQSMDTSLTENYILNNFFLKKDFLVKFGVAK